MDHRDLMAQTQRWYTAVAKASMLATVSQSVIEALAQMEEDGEADPNGLTAEQLTNNPQVVIRFEVCPTCDGRGTHVNPSIDSHGLTSEDFADDPDFEEAYFGGAFDMECSECGGESIVPVPVDVNVSAAIEKMDERQYSDAMERDFERRMGC